MTIYQGGFEGQTVGATAFSSTTDDHGDAYLLVNAYGGTSVTRAYTDARAAHGTMSLRVEPVGGATCELRRSYDAVDRQHLVYYVWIDSLPTNTIGLTQIRTGTTVVSGSVMQADGRVQINAGGATIDQSAFGLLNGVAGVEWIRIEHIVDIATQEIGYGVYAGDSTTPLWSTTIAASVGVGQLTEAYFGRVSGGWQDDTGMNFDSWRVFTGVDAGELGVTWTSLPSTGTAISSLPAISQATEGTNDSVEAWVVRLTVTDNEGATSTSEILVPVEASVGVTGTVTSTLSGVGQAATGDVIAPQTSGTAVSGLAPPSQAADGLVEDPTHSGAATSTLSTFSQSAAGIVTDPMVFGAGASSLSHASQAASGEVVAPVFEGVSSSTLLVIGQQVEGTVSPPVVGGATKSRVASIAQDATGTHLGVPQNLVAVTISDDRIDLTWDAVPGADDYDIQRDTVDTFATAVTVASGHGANSYSDTGLDPTSTFYYRVRAGVTV